jgi:predicted O-linked N-acetylglucosamine transferase (SPINDLY family)
MNNIIALKNYSREYIYNIISSRYLNLKAFGKELKIRIIFKQLINLIRDISESEELDRYNTPMGFLFQHLRKDIINLVANCIPPNDRLYISSALVYNLDWNIKFFNSLVILQAKDIILWFFFQIPYYIHDKVILEKFRANYEAMLDYFLENWPQNFIITQEEFIFASNQTCMPYAIAYHNQNNAIILTKYTALLRKIAPWLNYFSPRIAESLLKEKSNRMINPMEKKNKKGSKKRICFISDSFNSDSSVLRDRIGIIGKLDVDKFEIWIASFNSIKSYHGILASHFIKKFQNQYIHLSSNLNLARTKLEELKLDVIIYPDLGMKLLSTLLAYSRIAPVQITTWGHSETSGIDTIDYYISSEWFEIESNQSKYSEKLILFKSLGTYYFSPKQIFIDNASLPSLPSLLGWKMKTREELGLPVNVSIYCCLQTFYKMTVEFEKCLGRILALDRDGIILLSNAYPYCQSHLARLRSFLGEDGIRRIRWYTGLEKSVFLNLVSVTDVVLDPFPFGGCNTTFEAFDFNIPVITWPSEFLHGRFTLGLYSKMNMGDCECITYNAEEYAQIAVKVAMNARLRHKLNRAIEEGKMQIFQEKESVEEWNQMLEEF